MKITNAQLKQIIKEEIGKVLKEDFGDSENYLIKNWQEIEEHDDPTSPFKNGDTVIEIYGDNDTSWIDDMIGAESSAKIQKMFQGKTVTEFFGNTKNGAAVGQFIYLMQTLTDDHFKGYPVGELYMGGNTNIRGYQITYDPAIGFSFVDESGVLISPVQAEGDDGRFYFEPGYTSLDSLFGYMQGNLTRRGVIEVKEGIRVHGRRSRYGGTQVDGVTIDLNRLIEELNNGNISARVDEDGDYHITNAGY
jgi:hypothetical protein